MSRRRRLVALAVASLWCASACSADPAESASGDEAIQFVATTNIWADVVSEVACVEGVEISSLLAAGIDPHSYEVSLADRADLERAALVIANGAELEATLGDTLDAVEDSGTSVFYVADHVDLRAYSSDDSGHDNTDHDDGHEHDGHGAHGVHDPHFWTDPIRVAEALPHLAAGLGAAGLDLETVAGCADDYAQELAELDQEVAAMLADIPAERRKLVTNHDTLGYFADRYGFEVAGTVLLAPSGLAETNPGQLARLTELIASEQVPAVFANASAATDDAAAVADELDGVDVVVIYTESLAPSGETGDSYVSFVRRLAGDIARGLG